MEEMNTIFSLISRLLLQRSLRRSHLTFGLAGRDDHRFLSIHLLICFWSLNIISVEISEICERSLAQNTPVGVLKLEQQNIF